MKEIAMPAPGQLHEGAKENWTHTQNSIFDAVTGLASAMLPGQFSSDKILRLSGAAVSADTLAVAITAGWTYYQGKVYQVTAGTINPGEGNADDNLAESYIQIVDVGSDSAYQQSAPFRVYVDKRMTLVVGSGAGRIPVSDILDHIIQGLKGEIRDVVLLSGMDSEDVFAAATGLGANSWTGWAICDGRNGTPKLNGRARVGIGLQGDLDVGDTAITYAAGQMFGKNRIQLSANESGVREHTHKVVGYVGQDAGTNWSAGGSDNKRSGLTAGLTQGAIGIDSEAGRDGAQNALDSHYNVQPSYACICMVKL